MNWLALAPYFASLALMGGGAWWGYSTIHGKGFAAGKASMQSAVDAQTKATDVATKERDQCRADGDQVRLNLEAIGRQADAQRSTLQASIAAMQQRQAVDLAEARKQAERRIKATIPQQCEIIRQRSENR